MDEGVAKSVAAGLNRIAAGLALIALAQISTVTPTSDTQAVWGSATDLLNESMKEAKKWES